MKAREMSVFCRQMVTLLKAGISIVRSLEMLEEQAGGRELGSAIRDVRLSVESGETLNESMRRRKKVFPEMFADLVKAGEEVGKLEMSFERMAVYCERTEKTGSEIRKALIYPVILAVVSFGVIVILITYIVPRFTELLAEVDAQLPLATRVVIGISNFVTGFWWAIAFGALACVTVFGVYRKTERGRWLCDSAVLRLPVAGRMARKSECARFARNLGTMLGAGVPILKAVRNTAAMMRNVVFRKAVLRCASELEVGIPMADSMKESGVFPSMICNMTAVGEETGSIDRMLEKAAEYYEEDVIAAAEQMVAVVEPAVIIVMAFLVMGIIAAVYGPVITMFDSLI